MCRNVSIELEGETYADISAHRLLPVCRNIGIELEVEIHAEISAQR